LPRWSPRDQQKAPGFYSQGSSEYLRFLADNSYPLSPIEEVITGAKTADSVYDDQVSKAAAS
jgi:hypothetical protein